MSGASQRAYPRRSLLFAPASRPDMLDKALASSADMVCADLEDAVAPALKADARPNAFDFLAGAGATGPERVVRINPVRTPDGMRDLARLADRAAFADGLVMLAKTSHPEEVVIVDEMLSEHGSALGLILLIETARGLDAVMEIAAASPRTVALLFGAVDLAAELGVAVAHEPLLYARSRTIHAARRAGIGALDVPCLDFRNLELMRQECDLALTFGFTGKAAVHPSAIALINERFTPSALEVARARAVLEAFHASPTGLVVVDGKLIERPVVRAAEVTLARAAATGEPSGT